MNKTLLQRTKTANRPSLHFTSEKGWINDPNGLIYFKGEYHLFYQFNPYGTEWNSMHWGHAVSKDLESWEDLPIALYPDQSYDTDSLGGCFSGSALVKDDTLFIFYTGSIHKGEEVIQTQNIVTSTDGRTFCKYSGNPVFGSPEGASKECRDPKVFEHEGNYYIVCGGTIEGEGKIFLYTSSDLYNWKFVGSVLPEEEYCGTMIECPDLFYLEGKWVLCFSPMNHPERLKCIYYTGTMDFTTGKMTIESSNNADYGFDYYAPQTFKDKIGNTRAIAWMNKWQWMTFFNGWGDTAPEGWRCSLSLPRELHLDRGRLIYKLPSELTSSLDLLCTEKLLLIDNREDLTRLQNTWLMQTEIEESKVTSNLLVFCFEDNDKKFTLELDLLTQCCTLDLSELGNGIMHSPLKKGNSHNLLLLKDGSAIEVFIDDGYSTITANGYGLTSCAASISIPYREAVVTSIGFYE